MDSESHNIFSIAKIANCHTSKNLKKPLLAQKIQRIRLLLPIPKFYNKISRYILEILDQCAAYRTMPSSDLSISTSKRKVVMPCDFSTAKSSYKQRYTYRVIQTIQMELIFLCVWTEPAVLGSAKTALKFKYEI